MHQATVGMGGEVQGSLISKKNRTQPGFYNSCPYTKAMEVKFPVTGLVPAVAGTGRSPGCGACRPRAVVGMRGGDAVRARLGQARLRGHEF